MSKQLTKLMALSLAGLCYLIFAPSAFAATVVTDTTDYASGDSIVIVGAGFGAGETVRVQVYHTDGTPPPSQGEGHNPWSIAADDFGAFETYWIIPYEDHVDEYLTIAADGESSGLHAEVTVLDANTVLTFSPALPDTICPGATISVCALLQENCGGGVFAPLPNRALLFWINEGSCGVAVGQDADDTAYTDANGIACGTIVVPSTPGDYSIRVKFMGEEKPDPCPTPGNSACFPNDPNPNKRCTKFSASNDCEQTVVNSAGSECNQPPVASCHADTSVFACGLDQICIGGFSCSDPDGNLTSCAATISPAVSYTFDGTNFCFTPSGAGVYAIRLIATDSEGLADTCFTNVTVTLNNPPVANAGIDVTQFQCTPTEICIPAGCSDPDGNLIACELVSGTGTFDGSQICFTPTSSGTYTFVLKATDACGATDYDTSVATVTLNSPPVATCPGDTTIFVCNLGQICLPGFACSDPDNNVVSTVAVGGTLVGNAICFTPVPGVNTLKLICTDACGAADTCETDVTIVLNSPPVANAGRDSVLSQCAPAEICWPAGCSDPDGNLTTCELVSGTGTFDGSEICFTPTSSGTYSFVLKATDACGLTDYDTSAVTVTLNQPPVADAGRDSVLFQCTLEEICIAAGCSDPDGDLSTCQLISGLGSFNGSQICFLPPDEGCYTFILQATDACGATDVDTVVVCVNLNDSPVADAGRDSVLFQCTFAPICIAAGCSDPDGNLTTCELVDGPGAFDGSQICFTPTAAGTYTFVLKATDACGLMDYDTSVVTLTTNQPPVADAGSDFTAFMCPTPICFAAGCSDPDGNLLNCGLVSGTGTFDGTSICFAPPSGGTYTFVLKATDGCGLTDYDTCEITVQVPPSTAIMAPEPIYLYYAHAVSPMTDTVHFGDFPGGYTAADVNLPTVTIDGLAPTSAVVLPSYPGYTGAVVRAIMPIATYVAPFWGVYDTALHTFNVEWSYNNAVPGCTDGQIHIIGHYSAEPSRFIAPTDIIVMPSDFDLSGSIDLSDVVALIGYIFAGGAAPQNILIGDADCSHSVDISDVVYLVQYIFAGGPAPCTAGK